MRKTIVNKHGFSAGKSRFFTSCIFFVAAGAVVFSIFGPSAVSTYHEAGILNTVAIVNKNESEGFRQGVPYGYVSPNEKLYILANALSNRILPQSDYSALIRLRNTHTNAWAQTYALLPNNRKQEADDDKMLDMLSNEIDELYKRGVMPMFEKSLSPEHYSISYFSAVDLHEPQKSVALVQFEFSQTAQLARINSVLTNCYMDEESGKLYGFSVRTAQGWDDYDPDHIMNAWSQYWGLGVPESIPAEDALSEDTFQFKRYLIDAGNGGKTTVTIGCFEGINELYLRISR